jgi:hypothetical protein
MKYAAEMVQAFKKLIRGIHRQHRDRISLLSFLKIRKALRNLEYVCYHHHMVDLHKVGYPQVDSTCSCYIAYKVLAPSSSDDKFVPVSKNAEGNSRGFLTSRIQGRKYLYRDSSTKTSIHFVFLHTPHISSSLLLLLLLNEGIELNYCYYYYYNNIS